MAGILCAAQVAQSPRFTRVLTDHELDLSVIDGELLSLSGERGSVATTMQPGDYAKISSTSLLLAGRADSGGGLLQRLDRNSSGAYTVAEQWASPTGDFVGIAYDAGGGRLFLLDYDAPSITQANWSGTGPLPTSWSTWATEADVPQLEHVQSWALDFDEVSGSLRLLSYDAPTPSGFTLVKLSNGTFVVTKVVGGAADPALGLVLRETLSEGLQQVGVQGPVGMSVEFVNSATSTVLGTGTIGATGTAVLSLSEAVTVGGFYHTREAGSAIAHDLVKGVRRYGHSETFASGIALADVTIPLNPTVGNGTFAVRVPLTQAPAPAADYVFPSTMAVAVRAADGTDPVVEWQGNALLLASVFIPTSGLALKAGVGGVRARLPIPNNSSLERLVVLVQFHFAEAVGSEIQIRRSEVLAFEVEPSLQNILSGGEGGDGFVRWVRQLCREKKAVYDPHFIDTVYGR